MDTSFAPEDIAFRDEVREFFARAYDPDIDARLNNPDSSVYRPAIVEWQKRLYEQGWIAPNWPVEHGGTGWNATRCYIYETERAARGIRDVIPFGLKMVGPVIYTFGNQEQKERFLPRILSSDDWWCQGYSEPGSGSATSSSATRGPTPRLSGTAATRSRCAAASTRSSATGSPTTRPCGTATSAT